MLGEMALGISLLLLGCCFLVVWPFPFYIYTRASTLRYVSGFFFWSGLGMGTAASDGGWAGGWEEAIYDFMFFAISLIV